MRFILFFSCSKQDMNIAYLETFIQIITTTIVNSRRNKRGLLSMEIPETFTQRCLNTDCAHWFWIHSFKTSYRWKVNEIFFLYHSSPNTLSQSCAIVSLLSRVFYDTFIIRVTLNLIGLNVCDYLLYSERKLALTL